MVRPDSLEDPVRKPDVFREQALQAWRGQEVETRVLMDLSPPWMRWAIASILALAALGVLLAATTSIPKRATATSLARLNAGGDTVFVDAVFVLPEGSDIKPGQGMTFRPQIPGAHPLDLKIESVTTYPKNTVPHAPGQSGTPELIQVHAATPTSNLGGEARPFIGLEASGSAHVLFGTETLLHLIQPRRAGP